MPKLPKILCDGMHPHLNRLSAERQMPDPHELEDLAALFKLFGDPTRIRILCALYHGELCVCELSDILGMTQSAISHQLRILKDGRAVKARREGRQILYSLHDNHVIHLFDQGLAHIEEHNCDQ